MYGYLSKTKQSLALKLMAIYTLKSNILVYFSHLNYLLVLSRFKSLYFHFCETPFPSFTSLAFAHPLPLSCRFPARSVHFKSIGTSQAEFVHVYSLKGPMLSAHSSITAMVNSVYYSKNFICSRGTCISLIGGEAMSFAIRSNTLTVYGGRLSPSSPLR